MPKLENSYDLHLFGDNIHSILSSHIDEFFPPSLKEDFKNHDFNVSNTTLSSVTYPLSWESYNAFKKAYINKYALLFSTEILNVYFKKLYSEVVKNINSKNPYFNVVEYSKFLESYHDKIIDKLIKSRFDNAKNLLISTVDIKNFDCYDFFNFFDPRFDFTNLNEFFLKNKYLDYTGTSQDNNFHNFIYSLSLFFNFHMLNLSDNYLTFVVPCNLESFTISVSDLEDLDNKIIDYSENYSHINLQSKEQIICSYNKNINSFIYNVKNVMEYFLDDYASSLFQDSLKNQINKILTEKDEKMKQFVNSNNHSAFGWT